MPPSSSSNAPSLSRGAIPWRPTKIMNMRDLSKDDDFLSHLLVEKLGTGGVPLLVHKMDPSRRLPKTNADDLLQIVRRNMVTKNPVHFATRQAVQELLSLPPVRYYLKSFTQKQINAFATHASRYLELYHPTGSIEIAHTSRYAYRTGKSELCILATRALTPGSVISELKGSMANLTQEEDKELKRTDLRNSDIRRDFSVIHSKQMKKNHLFLGPARFVNHDCNNNCELFREGKYITFRVIRPIGVGEEITAHYGDGYFGRKNRHCLCETCEKACKGGYALDNSDSDVQSGSESECCSDAGDEVTDIGSQDKPRNKKTTNVNLNERRTRRGVYAIVQEQDDDSDESEDDETTLPLAGAKDIPTDGEIELESDLTSLPSTRSSTKPCASSPLTAGSMTPGSDAAPLSSISSLSSSPSLGDRSTPSKRSSSASFKSIIATRRQRAEAAARNGLDENSKTRAGTSPAAKNTPSSSGTPSRNLRKTRERLSTPAGTPTKDKEKSVKKEEPEARVLRTRPASLPNPIDVTKVNAAKPEIPRGPDGKPLPTCGTCSNILPVISVDSQVVWGLGIEFLPRKGKKRKHQDCPRCMRHFAIYAQPWPSRTPVNGSTFLPTPREESTPAEVLTKRVTDKGLPTLDKKLVAAASALPLARVQKPSRDERHAKRQKTESKVAETPIKAKSLPLCNERLGNNNPSTSDAKDAKPTEDPPPKRKRGRPRLSSPRRQVPKVDAGDNVLLKRKSIAVQNQPRDSNGRFGKKGLSNGRFARKKFGRMGVVPLSRAQRAIERSKVKSWLERRMEEGNQLPNYRQRRSDLEEQDPHSTDHMLFPGLTLAKTGSALAFKGIGLFRSPNPLSFARRTWTTLSDPSDAQLVRQNDPATTSGEDTDLPITPEDTYPSAGGPGLVPHMVRKRLHIDIDDDDESSVSSLPQISAYTVGALTLKPSPFNFARRRWASLSVSPESKSLPGQKPRDCPTDNRPMSGVDQRPSSGATIFKPDGLSDFRTGRHSPNEWLMDYESSSGEEDVVLPDSPDPSMFVLQRRASFGPNVLVLDPTVTEGEEESVIEILARSASPNRPMEVTHDGKTSGYVNPKPAESLGPSLIDAGWEIWSDSSFSSDNSSMIT